MRLEITDDVEANFADLLERAIAEAPMKRTGARLELIMTQRTRRGEFLEGSSPGASEYSTEPFAMPAGALRNDAREELTEDEDVATYFTSEDDLWLRIEGGYKRVRKAKGLQADHVNLTDRGNMLDGMRTRVRTEDGEHVLDVGYIKGRSPTEATRIAGYHNRQGAGPSQVKRVFVGATDEEAGEVLGDLEDDVLKSLAQ